MTITAPGRVPGPPSAPLIRRRRVVRRSELVLGALALVVALLGLQAIGPVQSAQRRAQEGDHVTAVLRDAAVVAVSGGLQVTVVLDDPGAPLVLLGVRAVGTGLSVRSQDASQQRVERGLSSLVHLSLAGRCPSALQGARLLVDVAPPSGRRQVLALPLAGALGLADAQADLCPAAGTGRAARARLVQVRGRVRSALVMVAVRAGDDGPLTVQGFDGPLLPGQSVLRPPRVVGRAELVFPLAVHISECAAGDVMPLSVRLAGRAPLRVEVAAVAAPELERLVGTACRG